MVTRADCGAIIHGHRDDFHQSPKFIIPVNGMFNLVPIWGCPQKINGRNAFILWSVTNTQFLGRTLLDALATNPEWACTRGVPNEIEHAGRAWKTNAWENHVRY